MDLYQFKSIFAEVQTLKLYFDDSNEFLEFMIEANQIKNKDCLNNEYVPKESKF